MSDKVLSVQLAAQYEPPELIESKGKKIVEYGKDNLYPALLLDIYNNKSSKHKAIINRKTQMIAGQGFNKEGVNPEVLSFLKNNFGTEELSKILYKCALDYEIMYSFALEVIWSNDKRSIASIKHVPASYVRIGIPDQDIKFDFFKISADWSQSRKEEYKPEIVKAFNDSDREGKQLLFVTGYSPQNNYYPIPRYSSSINWMLLDNEISTFHLSNVANGFMPSYAVNFMSGTPEEDEMKETKKQFTKTYTGAQNAGHPVLIWSDGKDNKVEFTKLELNDSDERFDLLSRQVTEEILIGHEVVNPLLFGVKVAGEMGGKQELEQALEIFQAVYVNPIQNVFEEVFNQLFNYGNTPEELTISKYVLDEEETQADSDTSYNGAQISSAVQIVQSVKEGILTEEQAIIFLMQFLQMPEVVAKSFFPKNSVI